MKLRLILFCCLMMNMPSVLAERIIMQGTAVIGNQELPKVLYIVPWKKSELPDLSEPPLESLIDEALKPIDRSVFRRQIEYYQTLNTLTPTNSENQ